MYTVQQLAARLGGQVLGNPNLQIHGVAPFERATAGDITFAGQRRYLKDLGATQASVIIVDVDAESKAKTLLRVPHAKVAFTRVMQILFERPFQGEGISSQAVVGADSVVDSDVTICAGAWLGRRVVVGKQVTIHPGVVVGNDCRIGPGSTLHPNVTLYPGVILGKRVVLHSGTVIGADGFGYVHDGKQHLKIPQTGNVIIEDDVEIGANSCVDRATFGSTLIEQGCKLDNHVHVGHNCRIGRHTIIVGQVGISGSVEIGAGCTFGGQAGVIDHIKIGDNVRVMVKTAVTRDIPSDSEVSGQPAMDHKKHTRIQALTRKLPDIYDLFRQIRRERQAGNDS